MKQPARSNAALRSALVRSALVRSALFAAGIVGCNAILDNKPGTLDSTSMTEPSPTEPKSDASTPTEIPRNSAESTIDSGSSVERDADPSSGCSPGQHMCHGFCVGLTDPTYGCGDPSCTPCAATHGTAACQGNICVVQACDKGYADCNKLAADGCEVDLSKATTCGACNAVCPAANPVCTPAAASFQCTTGCGPSAPLLCGNECVSPLTSANHCGGCNAKCADVDHAEVACQAGTCKFTCKADYHACAGKCVVNTDPGACGPACTVCPVLANAVSTCQADACGFHCNAGFGNCNANVVDGCESNFATDPLNCGGCGRSCNGGTCNAGICSPAPDAGN